MNLDVAEFEQLVNTPRRVRKNKVTGEPIEAKVTEDAEYIAMVYRMVEGLERRAINNPDNVLPHLAGLKARMQDIENVTIATTVLRYRRDKRTGRSGNDMARMLRITPQAITAKIRRGEQAMFNRIMGLRITSHSERARRASQIKAADRAFATGETLETVQRDMWDEAMIELGAKETA